MDTSFGFDAADIKVSPLPEVSSVGSVRRVLHFHRFRSRGREVRHDPIGAFLEIIFPVPVEGPITLGYGSHFGLGLFFCG